MKFSDNPNHNLPAPSTYPQPTVASVIEPTDHPAPSTVPPVMIPALRRLAMVWLGLFVASSAGVMFAAPQLLAAAVMIGVASGLISLLAMLPGLQLPSESTTPSVEAAGKQTTTILIAMAIRATGTVALFLICRYQMGLPPQTIALMVCGWYVLLTSVEVSLMARGVAALSKSTESTSE